MYLLHKSCFFSKIYENLRENPYVFRQPTLRKVRLSKMPNNPTAGAVHALNFSQLHEDNKTIIVLGLGRGGTSAAAGMLRELGVAMPHAHPLKHEWSPISKLETGGFDLRSTAKTVSDLNHRYETWGWKSPGDCFLLGQFQSLIRNPVLVIVFRNVLDTCLSGARKNGYPWEISAAENAMVLSHLLDVAMYSALPTIVVSYENLLKSTQASVREVNKILKLKASASMRRNAVAFIKNGRYSAISSEKHDGIFSEDELEIDSIGARISLYPRSIDIIQQRTENLKKDIDVAQGIIDELKRRLERRGPSEDEGVLSAEHSLEKIRVPATSEQKELAANLAEKYEVTREEYRRIVNERIEKQKCLDTLSLDLRL